MHPNYGKLWHGLREWQRPVYNKMDQFSGIFLRDKTKSKNNIGRITAFI